MSKAAPTARECCRIAGASISRTLRTRNGWFFWRALKEYRDAGIPIPDAMITKLDQISSRLMKAEGMPGIAKAVEMTSDGGGGQGRNRAAKTLATREIVEPVHWLTAHRVALNVFDVIGQTVAA